MVFGNSLVAWSKSLFLISFWGETFSSLRLWLNYGYKTKYSRYDLGRFLVMISEVMRELNSSRTCVVLNCGCCLVPCPYQPPTLTNNGLPKHAGFRSQDDDIASSGPIATRHGHEVTFLGSKKSDGIIWLGVCKMPHLSAMKMATYRASYGTPSNSPRRCLLIQYR